MYIWIYYFDICNFQNFKKYISFLVGIMYSFSTLGPALGYVIGGQLLNLYVDFYEVER